jgi:hypothetical protein
MIGTMDQIFPVCDLGLIRYRKPKVFYYQEGHKFPTLNAKVKETVRGFLEKVDEKKYRALIGYDQELIARL